MDRGECGINLRAVFDIVKADNAKTVAHGAALFGKTRQHSKRHKVVKANRGINLRMALRQFQRRSAAKGAGGAAVQGKGGKAPRLQGCDIARHAILGDSAARLPADKGDMLRAAIQQMLRSNFAAALVIGRGKGEQIDPWINFAQHLHHGQTCAQKRVKGRLLAPIGGRDHQGADAVFDHGTDNLRLQHRVFVGVGDHRGIAALRQRHLQRGGEFGEEWVAQIVDHHADQPHAVRPQIGRVAVVDIAQIHHHPLHRCACFGLNRRAFLKHQTDGGF